MKQGWEIKKIGEVCEVLNGFAFKSEKYVNEGTRIIRITNVQKGDVIDNEPKFYSDKDIKGLNQYLLRENDLLMSLTGNVGRVGLLKKEMLPAALNQRVACLRITNEDIILRYLFHCLNSSFFEQNAILSASGIAQKNMSTEWLKKYTILIPPLPEQKKIVSELDCLSDIIEKKRQQLKELDALAQSIFYEMFGNPVENEKGWEVKKLGEISIIGTGATPSRGNEGLYYGGDIPWVKTTEVQNCEITNTEEFITQQAIEETNCKVYPSGTLLMAMYGQGKTRGQIAKLRIDAATNQACAAIMLNKEMSNMDFIYELLLINYENIRAMAQGGNQANLNLKLVSSIPIILPPLVLQQSFASKIESIEQQKALIKQSIAETETLFNSRMDYYFN